MSTRTDRTARTARTADPLDHRISVGMTKTEHSALAAKAQHAGLSLARYLVEASSKVGGLKPDPEHFKRVEAKLRRPGGKYIVREFWHFERFPCDLSSMHTRLLAETQNPRSRVRGQSWVDHAQVGDVVAWELNLIIRPGRNERMGPVAGYRVGVVEMRGVKFAGWFKSKQQAAEAIDAILLAHGR